MKQYHYYFMKMSLFWIPSKLLYAFQDNIFDHTNKTSNCPPSVPCPPEGVTPVLDCSTNTARVDWQTMGGADFYVVQAFGEEGQESGCETAAESCSLTELACGITYNITVTASNSVCNDSQSAVTQLKAGEDERFHMLTLDSRIKTQSSSASYGFKSNTVN